jgi:hypothetical protein
VVDSQNRVVKISEFSKLLGQPLTTVKRLFANEVLDPELVQRTGGNHWRISFSPDDLLRCRASIALWKVLHRKPCIARSHKVRDLLQSLAIDLVLSEEISSHGQRYRSARQKVEAVKRALDLLKTRPENVEAIWWYEQILESPEPFAATFILRVGIERFRAKRDRPPKQRELAEELNISERSLYRWPFGRDPLRLAYCGRRPGEVETEDGTTDDRNESYISESEEELSPEKRKSQTRKRLGPGLHEVHVRRPVGENTRRKLRRSKARSVELAWGEDSTGPGKILVMYPVGRIEGKGRLELIDAEASCKGSDTRRNIKRNSRKIRRDLDLEERDSTFGGWTAAVYEVEADGKCRWWTNFDESRGRTDSAARAQHEILSLLDRCRARFPPMINLPQMLAELRN